MLIAERIRELRLRKHLTAGDIEKRTRLLRPYTSRVENGKTIPSLGTLQKYAHALGIPVYRFFYDGKGPARMKPLSEEKLWDSSDSESRYLRKLVKALSRMTKGERTVLYGTARRLARERAKKSSH